MKNSIILSIIFLISVSSLTAVDSFNTYKNKIEHDINAANSYLFQINTLQKDKGGMAHSGVVDRAKAKKIQELEEELLQALDDASANIRNAKKVASTTAQKSLLKKLTKMVDDITKKSPLMTIDL